ncbi:MAG: sulfite dehydrogenase [Planctomycetes bacterium]|nr:sulfite dehydrogenase [Planctomycetota bacterium]
MTTTSDGSRRRFLRQTAAIGATFGGVVATRDALAQESPLVVPPWTKTPGLPLSEGNYGMPSPFEKNVVRRGRKDYRMPGSGSIMTPHGNLRGTITPSGLVFERSHGGVPEVDPAQHRLVIHGLVRQPLIFTMDDIVRFPSVSKIHFLECSGNTSQGWMNRPATVQLSHGLLSSCEWTGVMLSTILDEAGVAPNASWLIAEGADSAGLNRSIPIAKCLEDTMLVYAQNGEALRPENGYPLRLLLPGWEGNMSIKWVRRLRLASEPAMTRWETAMYTESMPDGTARQFTFVMEAKSVITDPAPERPLRAHGFMEIRGIAWSGNGRIKRVDVSTDGGRNWRQAELHDPVLNRALTRFTLPWQWKGEPALIMSRAMDETGYVQPTHRQLVAVRGTANRYHYNAIQPWQIAGDGKVTNVFA